MGKTRLVSTAAASSLPADVRRGRARACRCRPTCRCCRSPTCCGRRTTVDGGRWLKEALADCAPYVAGSLQRLLPELEPRRRRRRPRRTTSWSRQRLFGAVGATLSALAVAASARGAARGPALGRLGHPRPGRAPAAARRRRPGPGHLAPRRPGHARADTASGGRGCGGCRRCATLDPAAAEPRRDRRAARAAGRPERADPAWSTGSTGAARASRCSPSSWSPRPTRPSRCPGCSADLLDRRLDGLGRRPWRDRPRPRGRRPGPARRPAGRRSPASTPPTVAAGLHELGDRRLLRAATGQRGRAAPPPAGRGRPPTPGRLRDRRGAPPDRARPGHGPRRLARRGRRALAARGGPRPRRSSGGSAPRRRPRQRFALAQAAEQWRRALDLWPDGVESVGSPPVRKLRRLPRRDGRPGEHRPGGRARQWSESACGALADPDASTPPNIYQRAAKIQGKLGDPEGALSSWTGRSGSTRRGPRRSATHVPWSAATSSWSGSAGTTRQGGDRTGHRDQRRAWATPPRTASCSPPGAYHDVDAGDLDGALGPGRGPPPASSWAERGPRGRHPPRECATPTSCSVSPAGARRGRRRRPARSGRCGGLGPRRPHRVLSSARTSVSAALRAGRSRG